MNIELKEYEEIQYISRHVELCVLCCLYSTVHPVSVVPVVNFHKFYTSDFAEDVTKTVEFLITFC